MRIPKFLLLILFIGGVFPFKGFAQSENTISKSIQVIGAAITTVVPDEFYLTITLQEYVNGSTKIDSEELEKRLLDVAESAGISVGNIKISSINGYGGNQFQGYDFLASKTYELKAQSVEQIDDLIGQIDNIGVTNVNLTYYSHSKIKEYMQDLKLKAIENARKEAEFLLKANNQSLGELLKLDAYFASDDFYPTGGLYGLPSAAPSDKAKDISIKAITLRYEVKAVYAIQ